MTIYVPGTAESDPKKQNRSLQAIAAAADANTTAVAKLQAGFLPGTTTNDNAVTGNIGEFVTSTVLIGSAVAIANLVPKDITSISLTAGDWDVWGSIFTNPIGPVAQTLIFAWVSSISATLPTIPGGGIIGYQLPFASGLGASTPVSPTRVSLAGTTTVFLSVDVGFTGGTSNSAYGVINARRAR